MSEYSYRWSAYKTSAGLASSHYTYKRIVAFAEKFYLSTCDLHFEALRIDYSIYRCSYSISSEHSCINRENMFRKPEVKVRVSSLAPLDSMNQSRLAAALIIFVEFDSNQQKFYINSKKENC
jgi:hypothetical protein